MKVVVIAGPNGAGKSTAAPYLLRGALGVARFVNADTIARGLDAFEPESVAFAAGRIILDRLQELGERGIDFAFETTLASRTFAPRIRLLKRQGYAFHLVFLYLPTADMAVSRVADRVRHGGHDVPEEVVRRRYDRGLRNFFELYRPLADTWWLYDNYSDDVPSLVACGFLDAEGTAEEEVVVQRHIWQELSEKYS